MKKIVKILTLVIALSVAAVAESSAQHTVAVTGGTGFATMRPYPAEEIKAIWGTYQAGLSWRYYSMPRFIACVGVDIELLQRGFKYGYPYGHSNKKDYKYYTRTINSIVIPLVWQPHAYLFKKRMRIYLEAAPTFSFNFASKFYNELDYVATTTHVSSGIIYSEMHEAIKEGKYKFRAERDNRFSYGLRGGLGVDLLFNQVEVGVRAIYDFGYSDIMRNRNKYYANNLDGLERPGENPFLLTPLRSPLDNLSISVRIGYRIGKAGFKEWEWKRPAGPRHKEVFKYTF